MERVDLLLVAAEQFEPFAWARGSFPEPAAGYESDADWNARLPSAFAGGALATFVVEEPLSYLYWAYRRATFEAVAAREDPAERTSAVVSIDALAMLLRQIGVESRLPARHARFEVGRAPRSRAMRDLSGRQGPWFYRAALASPGVRRAVGAIADVMRARQRMNARLRKVHERESPEVPWARSERGSRQTTEGLRLLLLNAWTVFFAGRTGRDETFSALEKMFSVGVEYASPEMRPIFVGYAGPGRDSAASRAEYAAHGENMARKLVHLAVGHPDVARSEALDLLAALESSPVDEVEPGVLRYDPAFPLTETTRALAILRAWRAWTASGSLGAVPDPDPPRWTWLRFPRRVPLAATGSSRPFADRDFDPRALIRTREMPPLAIDLGRFRVEECPSRSPDALADRSQLRVAALANRVGVGSPVPLLGPMSSWTFANDGRDVSLNSGSIELGGATVEVDLAIAPGAWALIRLIPVELPSGKQ